jgi:acyl-coenzyme A synthetase/AMP-(fatty) acid ligase
VKKLSHSSGGASGLFTDYWERVLADKRDEPALFSSDGSITRTFGQIEQERNQWRGRLSGFLPGDCVIGALGNDPSWPAFLLACWDTPLVLVPIEPDIPATQLEGILRLAQAQGIVRLQGIERFAVPPLHWTDPRPDLLKITSGTTGAPRAVRTRQLHLLADCQNICRTKGIGSEDINFGVIPFSHSYGFSNLLSPLIYQGSALVCADDRMPRAIHQQLRTSKATVFPGTPALFQALASLSETQDLGAIRLCVSAGAPLVPAVSRAFFARFGLRIHNFYGSSECGGIAYDHDADPENPIAGSPMIGVELERIGNDRIAVHGANVTDGYFPHPDRESLDGKRFVPGDIVEWSGATFRLVGRVSDIVNVAGKKVHPSIVEEHLRKFPGVMDVIVFGVPSHTRNEDLIAYVVGKQDLSRQALETHCRASLSTWQVPRNIQVVESLPTNERGKISRGELAKRYLEGKNAL